MNTLQTTNNETLPQPLPQYQYFTDYFRYYITQMENGNILTDKGTKYTPQTIRQYKGTLKFVENFETKLSKRIESHEISTKMLQAMQLYGNSEKRAKNGLNLYLSKVKAINARLYDEGIAIRQAKLKTQTDKTTKIYLPMTDIKRLTNNETKITQPQQRILDTFICQCFLGLRYSTYQKFAESPLSYVKNFQGKAYVDIVSDKTGEQSVIPLNETVVQTIKKYNGKLPIIQESQMNRDIKTVAKKRGLTEPVVKRITIGGETTEEMLPKYKEISTHTARRTFVSLAKQYNLQDRNIMAMTGHKSERQLNSYDQNSNVQYIKGIFDNEFFKLDLTTDNK